MKTKTTNPKTTNPKTTLILPFILVMLILVLWIISGITEIAFNPANQNIPKATSSPLSYGKHLSEAKGYLKINIFRLMENHLIKAEWDAREKGIDIVKKIKEVYFLAARASIEEALVNAIYGHIKDAKYELTRYQRYCSNAGIQPDKEKIAEVEKIIQRN